jgi:glycosyltransferase involved in cell wall biosynthesis
MIVTVVTHFPSPYQVELFNCVATCGDVNLQVVYLHAQSPERRWHGNPITHDHAFCEGTAAGLLLSAQFVGESDLVVFNYYRNSLALAWINARSRSGRPWAFWGERLGFRFSPMLGRIYRRLTLRSLHRSSSAIWGIGRTAVTAYQLEFGRHRHYKNVPYFSNLSRFADNCPKSEADSSTTILFSGSLILRKGVDLLARAFSRVAAERPHLRLRVLGDGPLLPSIQTQLTSCADRVEYLGFKDWNELPSAYATADVLCAPSRYDGWGLIVPEALAAGLPVISTTTTGAAVEFIKTDWNGWLIPPNQEEPLYRALRRVSDLRVLELDNMARRARTSVSDHQLQHGVRRFCAACRCSLQYWKG